jgi:23S rRNA pseudouridine955/2504/2580 synthase
MSEPQQNKTPVRTLSVDEAVAGQRIDNFLIRQLKGVPKSYVYRILRRGEVRVNKGRIKAGYRLKPGDLVRIPPVRLSDSPRSSPGQWIMNRLDGAVLYEDDRFLVLNKPSGLAVHGGSGLSHGVIEALREMRPQDRHLELVHRLDRETSGCLLIARKRSALRILHELLRTRQVQKRYLALLAGNWPRDRLEVDEPLLKNRLQSGERMVRVDSRGKRAQTRFRVLQRYPAAMLVEAELMTGRTHQIRVHAAHLGTPILGDDKYGDDPSNHRLREKGLKRLFLHAASLSFQWPEEEGNITVKAPLGSELEALLERLEP